MHSSLDIVKIAVNGAVLKDFVQNEYLIKRINDYKPDFIVIQESIIGRRKKDKPLSLRDVVNLNEIINIIQNKIC